MHFKLIITLFILMPICGISQIRFVDTVSISGYFYEYLGKYHKTFWVGDGLLEPYHYFVPASTLQQRSLKDHFKMTFNKELDTVKFFSCQVREEKHPYETADESVRPWIELVKNVKPFYVGQKSYSSGIKDYPVCISYANIQWLHLRMPAKMVACWEFNQPVTFDCGEKAKGREYDVYLPLKLLELEQGIKLKHGVPVHPTKKQ